MLRVGGNVAVGKSLVAQLKTVRWIPPWTPNRGAEADSRETVVSRGHAHIARGGKEEIMTFARVWFTGYINPGRFVEALRSKPAPHWGFYALVVRSLMDSLLLFLPVALLGRQPPTPSYLTFIPTGSYYAALVWLTPLVFVAQWLLGAGVIHVVLRLGKQPSDLDQILNLTGMASLVVGAFLVVWDWFWFLVGGANQYFLGISHLIIDIWWFVLVVTGLKRLLDLPVWLGIIMSILAFLASLPFAVIIMRAPF
jgi:hypothetical protein